MNRNLKYLTVALIGGAVSLAVGTSMWQLMPKGAVLLASGVAASLISHIVVSRITAPKINRIGKPIGDFHHHFAVNHKPFTKTKTPKTAPKNPVPPKGKTPKRKTPPKGKSPATNPTTDPVNDASDLNLD
jgi:hypothetical protein